MNRRNIASISVFDLDGVVINSMHRYKTVQAPNGKKVIDLDHWRKHEHLAHRDELLPHAKIYKKHVNVKSKLVIIATARVMRSTDFKFIDDHLGRPCAMVYRKHDEDTRKGSQLKIDGINKILNALAVRVDPSRMVVYEDNHQYLHDICQHFNCLGVYVPSQQGH